MDKRKLTPKQDMFVKEYLIDLNATQAAIRAGYSERTAYSMGQRLLKKVEIMDALNIASRSRAERCEISADWVINRLKLISDRCTQGEPVLDREGKPTGEWKFDASGANRATELLGKTLALFTDKQIVDVGIQIEQVLHELPD